MLKSFDTPVKRRVRSEYRSFLKETVLRHKMPKDVKVLCLPGHEAVEIYEVYDRLGIPRSNIYAAEWNSDAFQRLKALNLGIHLWHGDVFNLLGYIGKQRITAQYPGVVGVKNAPIELAKFEAEGTQVKFDMELVLSETVGTVPDELLKQSFDIIALDICGHVRAPVVTGISSIFRAGLLNDRGVFTLTSLAMREHPLTKMLIQMAIMMDVLVRDTMWEAAHEVRPKMVRAVDESGREMFRQRSGIDVLVILLGFGNELFTELLLLYKKAIGKRLLFDMPRNNIFDAILNTETDETAMIVRKIDRYAYQSGPSQMRTAFIQFRKAAQAIHETGSLMEVIHHLGHWLGSPILKIETPTPQLPRARIIDQIRKGGYTVEA